MKNRKVAGVLAICLGAFGVHKFYMGDYKKGILFLGFWWTGIPFILGWVDAFNLFFRMNDHGFDKMYNSSPEETPVSTKREDGVQADDEAPAEKKSKEIKKKKTQTKDDKFDKEDIFQTEIGYYNVPIVDGPKTAILKKTCAFLNIKGIEQFYLINKHYEPISSWGFYIAMALGYDLSSKKAVENIIANNNEVVKTFEDIQEKMSGDDWGDFIDELLKIVPEEKRKEGEEKRKEARKKEEAKRKEAEEKARQAADSYKQKVKNVIDSYSDLIEEGEEVIAVICGLEMKTESGEKTNILINMMNEAFLIATDRKVIYTHRRREGAEISTEEIEYPSLKGAHKKKFPSTIEVTIIGVDDRVFGVEFSTREKEASKAAQIFLKHVNQVIRGGGTQVAPAGDDIFTLLKKLAVLKDSDIITEEEFEERKKELLAKM